MGAAGGGRTARKGCRWRWTDRPQGVPLEVDGPPARDFIGRWAGRDLRDLRDLRDVAGARLRATPFASAKPASLFLVRSTTPGTIPEVSEVPAQAPVRRSGLRAFPVSGLAPFSHRLRAFPVTGPGICQAQRASRKECRLPEARACPKVLHGRPARMPYRKSLLTAMPETLRAGACRQGRWSGRWGRAGAKAPRCRARPRGSAPARRARPPAAP